jgi:hypothetical protein
VQAIRQPGGRRLHRDADGQSCGQATRRCPCGGDELAPSTGRSASARRLDPQPGAPQHDDQRVVAMAVAIVPGLAHDRDDLIDRWRVRRVGLALLCAGPSPHATRAWSPASGVARRRQAAAEKTTCLPPLRAGNVTRPALPPKRCRCLEKEHWRENAGPRPRRRSALARCEQAPSGAGASHVRKHGCRWVARSGATLVWRPRFRLYARRFRRRACVWGDS